MAGESQFFSTGEKINLLLQLSELLYGKDDYNRLLEIYQNLYAEINVANNCEINEVFLKSLDYLMTSAEQHIQNVSTQPDFYSSVVQCVTSCLRVCRNLCAICKPNQTIFHNSGKFVIQMKSLLSGLQARDCLTEEELVLFRCSVQFLCNYSSGNVENQCQVWIMFQDLFLWCLNSQDEKLQSYVQMGVHICLCDPTSSIEEKTNAELCWNILHRCVQLAVNEEAVNGLLVIEDALRLPSFCENVFPRLEDCLKILVLEVLINQFEKIPDEGSDARPNTCAVPCPSNVQYLAADFVVQAHHIPKMTADRPNDSKALCIVKELESLCLASVHHGLYSCLQEMQQLIKVSISLLQSVEDLGNDGNPMFAIADKMSDLGSIDQEHPVFGLKRDLIRLLGNLAYKNKQNQDLIREENGIPLILNKTNIDGKNPFIIQWSVLAIHNLTENNIENQRYIADLKLEGVANNQAVLEEMGLAAEKEGEKVVVKKKRLS